MPSLSWVLGDRFRRGSAWARLVRALREKQVTANSDDLEPCDCEVPVNFLGALGSSASGGGGYRAGFLEAVVKLLHGQLRGPG